MSHELFRGFPIVLRIPVQWGEMDAYGHLNNVVYFRYFESARVEYLVRCGFDRSYRERRVGAILHSTRCRFLRPLFYPDTVLVGTRAVDVEEDRFGMEYRVVSAAAGELAAEGDALIVSYDYRASEVVSIPLDVRAGMEILDLEGTRPGAGGDA